MLPGGTRNVSADSANVRERNRHLWLYLQNRCREDSILPQDTCGRTIRVLGVQGLVFGVAEQKHGYGFRNWHSSLVPIIHGYVLSLPSLVCTRRIFLGSILILSKLATACTEGLGGLGDDETLQLASYEDKRGRSRHSEVHVNLYESAPQLSKGGYNYSILYHYRIYCHWPVIRSQDAGKPTAVPALLQLSRAQTSRRAVQSPASREEPRHKRSTTTPSCQSVSFCYSWIYSMRQLTRAVLQRYPWFQESCGAMLDSIPYDNASGSTASIRASTPP